MPSAVVAEQDGWDAAYGDSAPDDVPEWVPPRPPPGTDLDAATYLRMWNGMETIPGDATDAFAGNYTEREALQVIAARRDTPEPRPPESQVEWNTHASSSFKATSPTESTYPVGTKRGNSGFFRDAYIRIGAITPSTVVHDAEDTTHLVRSHGGVLLASDYRVEPPNESVSIDDVKADADVVDVRVQYELQGTSQDPIRLLALSPSPDGTKTDVTTDTTNATGGNFVTYTGLNPKGTGNQVRLRAAQNFSARFLETEQHLSCDDPENRTGCEWVTVNTTLLIENITVTHSTVVTLPTGTPEVRFRPGPNKSYFQLRNTPAWSALTIRSGESTSTFTDQHAFLTKRDHQWDEFKTASTGGTTDPYQHPFTPVEVHAVPAFNETYVENPPTRPNQLTIQSVQYGPLRPPHRPAPRNVNVSSATAIGYRPLESATVTANILNEGSASNTDSMDSSSSVVLHSYVYGGDISGQVTKYPQTRHATLNLTAEPVFNGENKLQPEYFDIKIRLTEADTDVPIKTAGTNRTIRLSGGHIIETNASGIATYHGSPKNYSQTGIIAWFEPQGPFEEQDHYTAARGADAAPYPLQYLKHGLWTSAQGIVTVAIGGLPLLLMFLIAYVAVTGRRPW